MGWWEAGVTFRLLTGDVARGADRTSHRAHVPLEDKGEGYMQHIQGHWRERCKLDLIYLPCVAQGHIDTRWRLVVPVFAVLERNAAFRCYLGARRN